jgi:hypothetical protein
MTTPQSAKNESVEACPSANDSASPIQPHIPVR